MDWNTFVEGLKIFWNQPVPIIGFTVGTLILGILFVVGKTSIGKKSLNKIKAINEELTKRLIDTRKELIDLENKLKEQIDEFKECSKDIISTKDEEIQKLTGEYELKLINFKSQLLKQEELIKVICENSVNKKIKDAFEGYIPEELELPVSELKAQIEEKVKSEYDKRLNALEELVYGKAEEATND